jgi:hypothetical protein
LRRITLYTDEQIAKIIHAAMTMETTISGKMSPPWHIVAASLTEDVCMVRERKGMTPTDFHDNWKAKMVEEGFIYGSDFDLEAQTCPFLVPFDELPQVEQMRNTLFVSLVRALT